jgi:hypothetical protein
MVCRPTNLGGLDVLDLRFFGFALWLRWEWLSRTDPTRCWGALPSKVEKQVAATSAASMSVIVGDGGSTKLWMDNGASVSPLCHYMSALFAVLSRTRKSIKVKDGLSQNRWAREVVGALTVRYYVSS